MAPFPKRFSPPAGIPEPDDQSDAAWQQEMNDAFVEVTSSPRFFKPTEPPEEAQESTVVPVRWFAFPRSVIDSPGSNLQEGSEAWEAVDRSRDLQDEYCEWTVHRDGPTIRRITFTSRTYEYFEHLLGLGDNRERLLAEYLRASKAGTIDPAEVLSNGLLVEDPWNPLDGSATSRRPIYMLQGSNTLGAAIALVADAAVGRLTPSADGPPTEVVDQSAFARCVKGNPFRRSDPQIASKVREAVSNQGSGAVSVSLADPLGLYIERPDPGGIEIPGGLTIEDLWEREVGTGSHVLTASLAFPDSEFTLNEVTINGEPVASGSQFAEVVNVRIDALTAPTPERERHFVECRPR